MTDPVISDAVVDEACLVKFGPNWRTLPEIYKPKLRAEIRAAITAAVLAEREECARVADELAGGVSVSKRATSREASGAHLMALIAAAAIRARSTGGP